MSSTIKIIKGTTEVSLMDLSGLHLHELGWGMNPAEEGENVVRERISCVLIASDMDDASDQFQILNGLLDDAVLYSNNDPVQDEPVYIQTQHMGETNKRYAMIAGDYARFGRSPFDTMAQRDAYFAEVDLVITRAHPWSSHRPGILPGRIQLSPADGPLYTPDHTDFDVDLVSTFGQQPTTATGGIIGRPGMFGRGVQVGEAVENLITNPSFETDVAGYTKNNATLVRTSDDADIGSWCADFTLTAASGFMDASLPLAGATAGRKFTYYPRVKAKTAGDVGKRITLYLFEMGGGDGAPYSSAEFTLTAEWQLVFVTREIVEDDRTSLTVRIVLAETAGSFYIDAVNCAEKAYPLPHCDGSLGPGHSWQGVAHASKSDRVAHVLRYDIDDVSAKGTFGFWMKPIYEEEEMPNPPQVFSMGDGSADNRMFMYLEPSVDKYYCYYRGSAAARARNIDTSDIVRLTNHFIVFTWDIAADEFKIFLDGSQVGATVTGLTASSAAWDRLYIGANYIGGSNWSGWLDDIFLLNRVWSPDEVSDHHDSGKPFVGDPNLKFYLPFDGPRWDHMTNSNETAFPLYIYVYEDGVGYTEVSGEDEFTLFPNPISQNDALLFGSPSCPPKHLILNLRTVADCEVMGLVLEYWDDPAWIACTKGTDYTVYPGDSLSEMMTHMGNIVVNISPSADMSSSDPGTGDAGYYFRIRESHAAPDYTTWPVHAGQEPYVAVEHFTRIPATSLHGDAPPKALLRLHSPGGGDETINMARISRIIWGIKSKGLSRFESYLQAGDNAGFHNGFTITYGEDSARNESPASPGGAHAGVTFGNPLLVPRVMYLGLDRLRGYIGNYRVFILCQQISGDPGDVGLLLRTYTGGLLDYDPHMQSETVYLEGVEQGIECVDMGELNFPFGPPSSADDFSDVPLLFWIYAKRAGESATLRIYALVLIPIDQASGTPNDTTGTVPGSDFALYGGQAVDHDGGVIDRGTTKVNISGIDQYTVMGWDSGGPFVEINQLDDESRIYFLMLHYPVGGEWGTDPMIASLGCYLMVELQLHHSYSLLRGND